jgi:pilus assembly protein Flp/PilA
MFDVLNRLIAVKNDCRGVTAIEYALTASLVAIVLIAALGSLGSDIASSFTLVGNNIATTIPATK